MVLEGLVLGGACFGVDLDLRVEVLERFRGGLEVVSRVYLEAKLLSSFTAGLSWWTAD